MPLKIVDEASDLTPAKMDYAARRIAENRPMPLTDEEIREMAAYYADKYRCFVKDKYDHDAEVDAATLVQICDRLLSAEARVKALEDALRQMIGAVCGETGFAECVRRDSGHAYPWPALEIAETAARDALQEQSK